MVKTVTKKLNADHDFCEKHSQKCLLFTVFNKVCSDIRGHTVILDNLGMVESSVRRSNRKVKQVFIV